MRTATTRIRKVTLGDLIAAAFARAEERSPDPLVTSEIAARGIQETLEEADRPDLIRALARLEDEASVGPRGAGDARRSRRTVNRSEGRNTSAAA
jgi:hypothetical protein